MNKQTFVAELEKKLNESIPSGYELDKRVINKNGVELDTIICKPSKDGSIAPVFYTDNLYDLYESGETIENIVNNIVEQSVSVQGDTEVNKLTENLSDKNYVLDNVYAVLVGSTAKSQIEKDNLISEPFHDMYVVYEVEVRTSDNVGRVKVSRSMLENCGITEEELTACGKSNSREKLGYTLVDLGEVLGFGCKTGQYVLTNKDNYKGAYSLFCADLKRIADEFNNNLILLPSSIHEWLVMPESITLQQAESMVRTVNDTEVKPEERLSYTVYYYDRENGTLGEMVA